MKKLLTLIAATFTFSSISALDLSFRIAPGLMIPSNNYENGFNLSAQADVDLFGFMTAGLDGFFTTTKPKGLNDNLNVFGGGLGLGFYYFPLSRLYLGAGGAFGAYTFNTKLNDESRSASDLYWRAYGELGFRFTPNFILYGTGGYNTYMVNGDGNLMDGINAGLGFRFNVATNKKNAGGVKVSLNQETPAFPLYMSAYRNCPLGVLSIRNGEGAEIKNVKVSFRAGKYTASTFESANISRIGKYKTVEIPLYADFSTEIMKFSENGKINGEVVIEYKFLGATRQSVQSVVLDVYNRNAFLWADQTGLASFISPDTPEILEFAKYVAGIARNDFRSGVNRNVSIAANIFEALRLSKIQYVKDSKVSPYEVYHLGEELDTIQYPLQVMNMLGGDVDELGILLASCLESVGVGTGFMLTNDDFIVLVNLGIKPSGAGGNFAETNGLIIDEKNVYFGLSMKNFGEGFTKSRNAAFKKIAEMAKNPDNQVEYTDTHEAWETYSTSIFTGSSGLFLKPTQSLIEKYGKQAVNEYITSEIERIITLARKSGDTNRLGLALVRVGRYAEAKAEFSKSNSIQSMNNLANVYMIEKNYSAAKTQYEKVLAKDPENAAAKKGLEKIKMM